MTDSLPTTTQEKVDHDDGLTERVQEKASNNPLLNLLRAFQEYIQARIASIRGWKLSVWAQQYNPSQWCYFAAGILFIFAIIGKEGNSYSILAGWVAFFGLGRELLHLFQRIWDTTLGKGAILILYASTANVALAFAAMKINLISGVEPMPFVFTLGFTTLVLMPFWITLSTVLVFLLFLILVNLWLLIRLPIKLIGFDIQLHWEDKKRAVLTMFLRIALIPLALVAILEATTPYFADFIDDPTDGVSTAEQIRLEFQQGFADGAGLSTDSSSEEDQAPFESDTLNDVIEEVEDRKRKGMVINQLIADFIWYFEAYPKSFCEKPENVRSVPIEEGVVLFIHEDEKEEIGYRYEVVPCVLRNNMLTPLEQ